MRNTYRIYNNKFGLFQSICQRDHLQYVMLSDNGIYKTVSMDITRKRFKEVLEDIACEEQRLSYPPATQKAPVVSANTVINNPEKLKRLMELSGVKAFRILHGDEGVIY